MDGIVPAAFYSFIYGKWSGFKSHNDYLNINIYLLFAYAKGYLTWS